MSVGFYHDVRQVNSFVFGVRNNDENQLVWYYINCLFGSHLMYLLSKLLNLLCYTNELLCVLASLVRLLWTGYSTCLQITVVTTRNYI